MAVPLSRDENYHVPQLPCLGGLQPWHPGSYVMGLTVILIVASQESNIWIGKQPEKQLWGVQNTPLYLKIWLNLRSSGNSQALLIRLERVLLGALVTEIVFLQNF